MGLFNYFSYFTKIVKKRIIGIRRLLLSKWNPCPLELVPGYIRRLLNLYFWKPKPPDEKRMLPEQQDEQRILPEQRDRGKYVNLNGGISRPTSGAPRRSSFPPHLLLLNSTPSERS